MCSQVCNGGEQTRYRECNNPAPLHGGKDCQGNKRESRTCNFFRCPGETIMERLVDDFILAHLRGKVLTRILSANEKLPPQIIDLIVLLYDSRKSISCIILITSLHLLCFPLQVCLHQL